MAAFERTTWFGSSSHQPGSLLTCTRPVAPVSNSTKSPKGAVDEHVGVPPDRGGKVRVVLKREPVVTQSRRRVVRPRNGAQDQVVNRVGLRLLGDGAEI